MQWLIALAGAVWIVVITWDTFEAIVLPRRVTRRFRTTRMFYRTTWWMWSAVARRMRASGRRETYLSYYGGRHDRYYEQEITRHLRGGQTLYTAAPDETSLERYLDYLRRFPQRAPYAVSKFTDPEVQRRLAEWIPQRRFDVAVCGGMSR